MFRTLIVCALLLMATVVGAAEPPAAPKETVVEIRIRPAAAPVPALKYQLLPDLGEVRPGNPIQGYLKCFMEQHNFFFGKPAADEREKWLTMPLKDLPAPDLLEYGGSALRQADYAARLETPDWQFSPRLKEEGSYALPLSDLQTIRTLTAAVRVRFRAQIAAGHIDDALRSAQTLLAMSRHIGEHPTLIGNLVGVHSASRTIETMEELVQQPGCPNLYWALTDLPDPIVDVHKGLRGDRVMWKTEFAALLNPYAPVGPEVRQLALSIVGPPETLLDGKIPTTDQAQFDRAIGRVFLLNALSEEAQLPKDEAAIRNWLNARVKEDAYMTTARKRLAQSGVDRKTLESLRPWQVVLRNETLLFEARNDEAQKAMSLPYWQGAPLIDRARENKTPCLFGFSTEALEKVRLLQVRVAQRFAMLRCVEAIRMYAAEHKGAMPDSLAVLTVPVPMDPVTGKPFRYEWTAPTATLQGTPLKGKMGQAHDVRYRLLSAKTSE